RGKPRGDLYIVYLPRADDQQDLKPRAVESIKKGWIHAHLRGGRCRRINVPLIGGISMDGRDWSKFLLPYEQAVEELKIKFKALRSELKKREELSPIEFVTGRVKRISSILAKAKR